MRRAAAIGTLCVAAGLSAAAVTADAQTGAVQYGGAGANSRGVGTPTIGLTRYADGSVAVRFGTGIECRHALYIGIVVRGHGKTTGTRFTASGHTHLAGTGRLTMTISGRFAGTGATGRVSGHAKGCKGFHHTFRLRVAAAPAGAPALPPARAEMFGVTSQSAGGVRLPVALRVDTHGRLYAQWEALVACSRGHTPLMNVTPWTRIAANGSFRRAEKFVQKYSDGSHDTVHATFAGTFVAGGASGTLSARVQFTDKHHRLYTPCVLAPQTWTATP
jgi:hypothetical protein